MLDANSIIGSHNFLFVTLDSLRFDVAREALAWGQTPNLAALLPGGRWEERRSPGTFTFPAHQAFFAGFLPTPTGPERPARLLACRSQRGTTIGDHTYVFDAPNIVGGLTKLGYHTVCIGGVGFFSKQTYLGSVLPSLFEESHWSPRFGVDDLASTEHQVRLAREVLTRRGHRRLFVFINVAATHVPHHGYLAKDPEDTRESQLAALAYVDHHLGRLLEDLQNYGPCLVVVCSDHGEAFGEDGYYGHAIAHPTVWAVPYAEFVINCR